MTALSYIALGSNLDNPLQQVEQAIIELQQLPLCHVTATSPLYQTAPIGPTGQFDYINGVVALETDLEPLALLDALQAIENQHGRVRVERWGARTLDLDILLYGQETIDSPQLTIPHCGLTNRNFVLHPLADIADNLVLPNGTSLKQLLENCPPDGMVLLSGTSDVKDSSIT